MVLGNGLKEIGAYIARSAKYLKQGTRNGKYRMFYSIYILFKSLELDSQLNKFNL